MKTIFALFLAASLSGCALIDAYFMAKYDTTEHDLVNKVAVYSSISKPYCSDSEKMKTYAFNLYAYSSELKNFSAHLPRNEMTIKMTDELHIMVGELNNKYTTSDNNKYKNIAAFAESGGEVDIKGKVTINGIGAFAKGTNSKTQLLGNLRLFNHN